MKNSINKLLVTALILFFIAKIQAQKVQYFYFAPEASMQQAFGDKAKVFKRNDHNGESYTELPGYKYAVIKSSNFTDFESIASPNMLKTYNRLISNTSLKKEIDNLLKLSDGIVDVNVMLVDDRTGFSSSNLFCPKRDIADNQLFVWPCARIKKKKTGTRYLGQVFLGERAALLDAAKTGGFINWEGTIIHEFSHTQFLPDPKFGKNKWKSVGISYGGDAGHWFSELMADEQMALDEGMGYFFGLAHNPQAAQNLIDFLNTKSPRFLLGSRSFLTGTSKMWNSPHGKIYSGSVSNLPSWINLVNTPLEGNYELRKYKWLDVPGKYMMYNEQMSEAYFYLYHRYAFADKKKAYNRVYLAAKEMSKPNVHNRYPTFAVNHMARNMELYASSIPGEKDATNNALVSSMFAYGLMDVLTHFGMSEEDFKKKLRKDQSGSALPLAYTQYWSQRANLKKLVCPFLGGSDCQSGTGNIDILKATEAMRGFFIDSNLILKQPF